MKKLNLFFVFLISLYLNGCFFALGQSKGLCESEGCDYSNAGLCIGIEETYKNRKQLTNSIEDSLF